MCDKTIEIKFPTLGIFCFSCNQIKNMRKWLKEKGQNPDEWMSQYKEQLDPFIDSCIDILVD